jgi:hypothetical protein
LAAGAGGVCAGCSADDGGAAKPIKAAAKPTCNAKRRNISLSLRTALPAPAPTMFFESIDFSTAARLRRAQIVITPLARATQLLI